MWNPPLLNDSGGDIGRVVVPENKKKRAVRLKNGSRKRSRLYKLSARSRGSERASITDASETDLAEFTGFIKRSHAADETARLLAHAVRQGIRSIAFCKTRMLAEWVYERTVAILKDNHANSDLAAKVEIYRGGYSANIRRKIERKLFQNELFGVVGTSALELGIDLGNIELTLHCGYPGSIASLMQQAGRAGRGASSKGASFAIMVCFSSPSEQVSSLNCCFNIFSITLFNSPLILKAHLETSKRIIRKRIRCTTFYSPYFKHCHGTPSLCVRRISSLWRPSSYRCLTLRRTF